MHADVLFRWKLEAKQLSKAEVVNRAIIPLFERSRVAARVSSYYVSKHDDDPDPSRPTVWLVLFGVAAKEKSLRRTVKNYLSGCRVVDFCVAPHDRMLEADCALYRRRLREVTDIALEFHASPQHANHRVFLRHVQTKYGEGAAGEPELRPYVARESQVYKSLSLTSTDDDAFWQDCFTWGPTTDLSNPSHWLFNIVIY